jgi:hypothetical protein
MLSEAERGDGGDDFFGSLGTAVKRKDELKPEAKVSCLLYPSRSLFSQPTHSKFELNTQYLDGKSMDEYKTDGAFLD